MSWFSRPSVFRFSSGALALALLAGGLTVAPAATAAGSGDRERVIIEFDGPGGLERFGRARA